MLTSATKSKKSDKSNQVPLLLILWLGTPIFCLFVVVFLTHMCIIAIARDSAVTVGTPQCRHFSYLTVLRRAALKTEPVGVGGRQSMEQKP